MGLAQGPGYPFQSFLPNTKQKRISTTIPKPSTGKRITVMIHQNTDVFIDTTLLPYYDETMAPEVIHVIFMELPRMGENVDLRPILSQTNFSATEGIERLYQYLNKNAIPYVKTVVHSFEKGRQQIVLGLSL